MGHAAPHLLNAQAGTELKDLDVLRLHEWLERGKIHRASARLAVVAAGELDIVDVKAPAGQFCLDLTRQTPIVLIGGGVGITPVLSMLNAVAILVPSR